MRTTCPKCSGTGTVSRFLDYKAGVCFDCGGTGTLNTANTPARGRKINPRTIAQAVGDEVLSGTSVDTADAEAAFEIYEGIAPSSWSNKDYDRRNALGRLIGRVI